MGETIADRMRSERDRLGWSQEDLAARIKIRQSFIGALEAESQKNSKWIPEIAHAFGVSAYWLKTGKGDRCAGLVYADPLPSISSDDDAVVKALASMDAPRAAFWRAKIISEAQLAELASKIDAQPPTTDAHPTPKNVTSDPSQGSQARQQGAK